MNHDATCRCEDCDDDRKREIHSTVCFAKNELILGGTPAKCSCGKLFRTTIALLLHQDEEFKKL